jgi:exonuclease SbcC
MIIKTIKFKNVKSYGNKYQQINFDDNGGLILLTGTNGSGKSAIMESIDIALFNQVRGKESSKIPLKTFPNRINKNLEVDIDFINNNNDFIKIRKKIDPNDLYVEVNEQNYTERFKLLNVLDKEKLIGFNYSTFKSFISLSMNDFLNFIHLKPEDKRNLLNRLFNLERIDDMQSITKEIMLQNKKEIEKLTIEISSIDKELNNIMVIIKNNKNDDIKVSKDDIKTKIIETKNKYTVIQNDIKNLNNKISDFQVKIQEYKNIINISDSENIRRRTELSEVKSKIKIFESGKCPYCYSDLSDDEHIKLLDELKIKNEELTNKILENESKIQYYTDENKSLIKQSRLLEDTLSDYNEQLIEIKSDAKSLKNQYDNYVNDDNVIVEQLKENGKLLLNDKKNKLNRIKELKNDINSLKDLYKILGEDGARKTIISSLVPPINSYLNKSLKSINYPYRVILNNNFDAEIYDKGELIHSETPSNGEIRMLNICIAISYIEMIRKNKDINVLFLDEVFSSIHKDNINLILNILKDFALKNKLNLVLVHHGLEELDLKIFDKIISVEKSMFSDITIR